MTALTWTHSQNTSDSTSITYKSLNEFAKYVEYKTYTDSLIAGKTREMKRLEYSYKVLSKRFLRYKDSIVPTLERKNEQKGIQLEAMTDKADIYEDISKKRWWDGLFTGLGIGGILGLLVALIGS